MSESARTSHIPYIVAMIMALSLIVATGTNMRNSAVIAKYRKMLAADNAALVETNVKLADANASMEQQNAAMRGLIAADAELKSACMRATGMLL